MLGYTVFIALWSLRGFPIEIQTSFLMPFLSDKPLGEDGYYMLTVAWNIASGNGIAIRPGQVTTGIQPLATFIYAIFAWLVIAFEGDKFDFVRTIILFGGLNQILFALIMGLVCAAIVGHENKMRAKSVGIIFVIIGTSFYLFRSCEKTQ